MPQHCAEFPALILLLVALQAPLITALGVATDLLATGAAFGVARLVFQDGHGAGLLGFAPQGFLDAWGPVFFFAMIFAILMDYTVFLLSSAKEHRDRSHDPREAMVGGVAHSGRVIFAAGAVMVAVFFTFALSDPLPPKEMGIILGIAVLLDVARPTAAHPGAAARRRPRRLVPAALAGPHPPRCSLRPLTGDRSIAGGAKHRRRAGFVRMHSRLSTGYVESPACQSSRRHHRGGEPASAAAELKRRGRRRTRTG